MARLLPILLLALCSSAFAKEISVLLIGANCESNADCLSGDTCSYGSCTYSKRGNVNEKATKLADGSLCLTDKNCKNYCVKNRCTSKSMSGGPCENDNDCFGKIRCKNYKCEYQPKKKAAPKTNSKPVDGARNLRRPQPEKKTAPKKVTPKKKAAAPKKASPKSQTKRDGKTCVWNAECNHTCIFGVCSLPLEAGGICAFSTDCAGDLVCKNSKCQKSRLNGAPNGKACKWDFQCKNICIFGKCENLRRMGQMCIKNIHCKGEMMCQNGKCAMPEKKGN